MIRAIHVRGLRAACTVAAAALCCGLYAGAAVAAPGAATAPVIPGASPSVTGGLIQSLLYLGLILGLIAFAAWAMKRYMPKSLQRNNNVKIVGGISIGGRERILVVEVAGQWIVVGAAPGRVSALSTMAKPDAATLAEAAPPAPGAQPVGANFAHWLKQTLDKRNGNNVQQ